MRGATRSITRSTGGLNNFNPRSPCGERPFSILTLRVIIYFNPRSPCGERRTTRGSCKFSSRFQPTLPMRGATTFPALRCRMERYFNPRSPCGERRKTLHHVLADGHISTHAPHAGSDVQTSHCEVVKVEDFNPRSPCGERRWRLIHTDKEETISTHAPHAGSDGSLCGLQIHHHHFNPRSPCGERLQI